MSDTSVAAAGALPATGAGPFTLLLGLIGLTSVAVGAAAKWASRRRSA